MELVKLHFKTIYEVDVSTHFPSHHLAGRVNALKHPLSVQLLANKLEPKPREQAEYNSFLLENNFFTMCKREREAYPQTNKLLAPTMQKQGLCPYHSAVNQVGNLSPGTIESESICHTCAGEINSQFA